MNFTDTLQSVDLVLATGEVPLIIGESGIGKTALAKEIAKENNWSLIVIDGNLLKEGEIGGLPTVETYFEVGNSGIRTERKTTVYAVHNKLRQIGEEILKGNTVLLFIDELNRCEHTVQQELMNLILNREINGYQLPPSVKILAAMNPSSKYGGDFNYQVVDMDAAQENRFVWLFMEPDYLQWLAWAMDTGLEQKVIEFIATYPEYLHKTEGDGVSATPRSYERISKTYATYKDRKDSIPRSVFLNVLKGNVGKLIAEELFSFMDANHSPLLSFDDIFNGDFSEAVLTRIQRETHTRLYLTVKNLLRTLTFRLKQDSQEAEYFINRLLELLKVYPVDLRIGIMKDIKNNYSEIYKYAIENEVFVELFFESYGLGG